MVHRVLARHRVATYAALWIVAAARLAAQTAAVPRGVIQGTAIDSVRSAALAGAFVELVPGGRQVATGRDGAFRFDSVAPGESYHLRVMHALLDTLGVSLTTPRFALAANETKAVDVSVPPPHSIVAALCPPAARARGPAALVGFVRDPDTGAAIDSVTVSLVYQDAMAAFVRSETTRSVQPDAAGRFVICGLPTPMSGHARLIRAGFASADIPLATDAGAPLVLRSFGMSLASRRVATHVDSTGSAHAVVRGDARFTGRVVTRSGTPIVGARVQMDGTVAAAITDAGGGFALDSVPTGTQVLRVRKIGFAVVTRAVDVSVADAKPATIVMADVVVMLPTVVTRSDRNTDLAAIGFTRRRALGLGVFLEGEQIDRGPPTLGESLRMVPGLRIGYDAQNARAQKSVIMPSRDSRACLRYVVDGVPFQEVGGDIEKLVRPSDVEAIEMYNPAAMPGEFAATSRGKCSVLVLWTNHLVRRAKKP